MAFKEFPVPFPAERSMVELQGIRVSYGNLLGLEDLSLTIASGEIHAIVGEHGAGKSSVARVLAGLIQPEEGRILWKGRQRQLPDVNASRNLGIELVSQDNEFFQYQPVAYNLFVNRAQVFPRFFFNRSRIFSAAEDIFASMEVSIPVWKKMADISLPERVLVDIIRHLYPEPQLLILDEALEKLAAYDLVRIRGHLRRLVKNGSSVLFITHRIDDIYEFSDRVTIIRDGRVLITESVREIDKISLIKLAYTQISENARRRNINREFYEFLKYNEAILERLPVNLMVVDHTGVVKLMNKEAVEYLHLEDKPSFGRHITEVLDFLIGESSRSLLKAISEGAAYTAYDLGLEFDGERRIIDMTLSPIRDGLQYIGCILIINDITEQQQLRERIVFSEKLASVGLLAAGVAHEINNPLEAIYSCTDTLKLNLEKPVISGGSGSNAFRTVERLESEAEAIEHIVRNLISFGDEEGVDIETIDLNELLEDIINLVRYNTRYRKISIDYQSARTSVLIRVNKIEMKQVILNLFKNAIEAMANGGSMGVFLTRTGGSSPMAELTVEDSGPGIPAGEARSIFLPFYSTKRGASGHMGLGLSISYNIVKKMGGEITAENLSPSGCRFMIRLPAAG
ncbi:MAG: ATP-binding cassette domain-containing protein [Treponema sp.]|jgi:PAS domain S-box-containing protein|nr:ATP-binding cassette domain-containing protein [Treponema sp.]